VVDGRRARVTAGDQLADGRAVRVLTVVAQRSRQSPVPGAGFPLRGTGVAAVLDRVGGAGGTGELPRSTTASCATGGPIGEGRGRGEMRKSRSISSE
jgi:hypothetical protein